MRDHSAWGYAIPEDHESIVVSMRLPSKLVGFVKSLTTTERGGVMSRGAYGDEDLFPWSELERLRKFEDSVKTAQNTLGETP